MDMVIHPTKSMYITVNADDHVPFQIDAATINRTEEYVYLGAPISNNTIQRQIESELQHKTPHVLKFASFLAKNSDCPFPIKLKVWDSALLSAVFYGSETWLTETLTHTVEKPYKTTLKQLLGVRRTTCNDLAHLELGVSCAKASIHDRQTKFVKKLMERPHSYVADIVDMAIRSRSKMGLQLQSLASRDATHVLDNRQQTMDQVRASASTKKQQYANLNQSLEPSPIYRAPKGILVPEHLRTSYTRLRLSSHNLRIETGRWARIPENMRLCQCGNNVQSEHHALLSCPLTADLRNSLPRTYTNLNDLFMNEPPIVTAMLCHRVLQTLE